MRIEASSISCTSSTYPKKNHSDDSLLKLEETFFFGGSIREMTAA